MLFVLQLACPLQFKLALQSFPHLKIGPAKLIMAVRPVRVEAHSRLKLSDAALQRPLFNRSLPERVMRLCIAGEGMEYFFEKEDRPPSFLFFQQDKRQMIAAFWSSGCDWSSASK